MTRHWWPVHEPDEIAAVIETLRSGKTNYWTGTNVRNFENEFAEYVGTKYALAVTNGTTALELALRGCNITDGEVIVPCRTFVATAAAVATVGAQPILADIEPASLNVTVDTISARLSPRTVAVIVVHYAGWPVDMEPIKALCREHQLYLIEDCAHAHGASAHGVMCGAMGHIGCFSFCQGKIMSTGGEGGMVVTDSDAAFETMSRFRDHGRYQMTGVLPDNMPGNPGHFQWTVSEFGSNLRMTEMQAAIGRLQLKKLPAWIYRRNQIANIYDEALRRLPGVTVLTPHPAEYVHARYMYLFQTANRDVILTRMQEKGFGRIGGCPNIGYEAAFLGVADACPVADMAGGHVIALPIYPTMTEDEVLDIAISAADIIGQVNDPQGVYRRKLHVA